MRFQWLLCGTADRWYRAICRFGPETLPRQQDRLVVSSVSPAQMGHACRQAGGAVVLWPLLEIAGQKERKSALSALASLSHLEVRTLDLIEPLDVPVATRTPAERSHLNSSPHTAQSAMRMDLLQLGGNAVLLEHPQDLDRYVPLIRRFWNSIRPPEEPIESYYVPRS